MSDNGGVLIQFVSRGDVAEEEDRLRRFGADVDELGLGAVEHRYALAEDAKAGGPGILEWVNVAVTAGPGLMELLKLAGRWTRSEKHPVRVRLGDDELVLDDATEAQQDAIVAAFLARHPGD